MDRIGEEFVHGRMFDNSAGIHDIDVPAEFGNYP
jgi:hypothetical protein